MNSNWAGVKEFISISNNNIDGFLIKVKAPWI